MTINGPAPAILAMFVAAAKRRFGPDVVPKLRGTIQADVLKEVQAQNEILFPIDASLRKRGIDINQFGPRLSFFLDCGLDIEYLALARVCRRLWAIGMRDVFGADQRAQLFKLHTQTSGRSLVSHVFKNNLTRTAIELLMAYVNGTNSCHSNSADEPFTTPGAEYVRLAANAQAIILEESGLFKHMMNTLGSSPGMQILEKAVEEAVLAEFRQIEELGGVLPAIEHRYQRSQIQSAAHRYEMQISDGTRPIIGLNRYRAEDEGAPEIRVVRTPKEKKELQVRRLTQFKKTHRKEAGPALDALTKVVENGGNVFAELIDTVEHCSLGQITERLHQVVGRFRPTI
jgi:methylmalonyl-CoA mutase cobalamin-binding domain/chain